MSMQTTDEAEPLVPSLDGENARRIVERYGLNELFAVGSSADLYKSTGSDVLRLSIDAGSHQILVHGSRANHRFPRVIRDFGKVGVSDLDGEDNYWLLEVERCHPMSVDFDHHEPLISALLAIDDELQSEDPGDCVLASALCRKNAPVFREFGIQSTMEFIISFAGKYGLNVDVHPSNFMLNNKGLVVAVDPVFGPDPTVFD